MIKKEIGIIYFAYINPNQHWKEIIRGQIKDIKLSKIMSNSSLYVVISNPCHVPLVKEFFLSLNIEISSIDEYFENKFEYYPLEKLWLLAKENFHNYFVYLHTKGMSYKKKFSLVKRNLREIVLTHYLFKDYKITLSAFNNNKNLAIAGPFPAITFGENSLDRQFIWFNFMWLRASYVCKVEEPKITDNRFYYESWSSETLNSDDNSKIQAYSTLKQDYCSFKESEATKALQFIKKIVKYTYPLSLLYLYFSI